MKNFGMQKLVGMVLLAMSGSVELMAVPQPVQECRYEEKVCKYKEVIPGTLTCIYLCYWIISCDEDGLLQQSTMPLEEEVDCSRRIATTTPNDSDRLSLTLE